MSRIAKADAHEPRRRARLVVLGFGMIVAGALGGLLVLVSLLT